MPLPLLAGAIFSAGFWTTIRVWALTMLLYITPYIARGLMMAFGVGFVTYVGTDLALDYLLDILFVKYSEIPTEVRTILTSLGVQNALNILTSGLSSALTLKALGSFTKFKLNRPAGGFMA